MRNLRLLAALVCLAVMCQGIRAAPKQFSCMSYLEDDKSLQDEEFDSEFDEEFDSQTMLPPTTAGPHRRICQSDYTFCFALWRRHEDGTTQIEKQGCWKESTDRNATCSQRECASSAPTSRNNSLYYCCCSGELCNQQVMIVEPSTLQLSNGGDTGTKASNYANARSEAYVVRNFMLWTLGFVVVLIVCSGLALCYFHGGRDRPIPEEAPLAPAGPGYSSNLRNVDNMHLISMLGTGKYGTVMKGLLHDQEVAVKIFPHTHYHYYINERNIYSLPHMDNPSLLTYFGFDERVTLEGRSEYHLVLSLAPLGCLQDWLISNTLDFELFCRMARSITRGLSHLHTELRQGNDGEVKPCIAHRDLNTRNILVKDDRSCCIADFGFALKVFGSKYEYKGELASAETKSINEVGTLRYMAPELLEGAVNLRDCETSLKQMDVYALGLVLWEVATRCVDFYPPGQQMPPYKAPYELEVGAHPTFDQMLGLVVRHKARPLFPVGWSGSAAAKLVKDTCEDCWDHDAEARLTSLCAEERMQEVAGLKPRLHAQSISPLLNTNNNLSGDVIERCALVNNQNDGNDAPETLTGFNAPPNQQIRLPTSTGDPGHKILSQVRPQLHTEAQMQAPEKNHLINPMQQLQPYQGRNPCQERNLAPTVPHVSPVLIERSKKHSFQPPSEANSFSCLENDVSVEELISGAAATKFGALNINVNVNVGDAALPLDMGQGFPKKHNTERKLNGWHGVRALIHKKLFRNYDGRDRLSRPAGIDEKSNLVEHHRNNNHNGGGVAPDNRECNHQQAKVNVASPPAGPQNQILPENEGPRSSAGIALGLSETKRPSNLNVSPIQVRDIHSKLPASINGGASSGEMVLPTATSATAPEDCEIVVGSAMVECGDQQPVIKRSRGTPAHVVPRSVSTGLLRHDTRFNNNNHHNNNKNDHINQYSNCNGRSNDENRPYNHNRGSNLCDTKWRALSTAVPTTDTHTNTHTQSQSHSQSHSQCELEASIDEAVLRRQRSLEVFREVFHGRGSTERLRDPSQRVKTPGDVPASVRKVRASKTLSLYDDRMMDATNLNFI